MPERFSFLFFTTTVLFLSLMGPLYEPTTIIAQSVYDCSAQNDIPQDECAALLSIYEANKGEPRARESDKVLWDFWFYDSPCNWQGITCDSGHISELNFHCRFDVSCPPAITIVPSEIKSLNHLKSLDLSQNNLGQYPEAINQLENLSILDLSSTSIESPLHGLGKLKNLSSLNLSNNRLSENPYEVEKLTNLRFLDLTSNELSRFSIELSGHNRLYWLHLGHNQLSELPESIGELPVLHELSLDHNHLENLPSSLGNLTQLTSLTLDHNRLATIPSELNQLTQLTELNLSHNHLSYFSKEVGQLTHFEGLNLDFNQFDRLPGEIGQLTNIQTLTLNNNQLTELPSEIVQLSNLRMLSLDHNYLEKLPNELGNLAQLGILSIGQNQVQELPENLPTLLTHLMAAGNQISTVDLLPSGLTFLDLSDNQLVEFPRLITSLDSINTLLIHDNPIVDEIPASLRIPTQTNHVTFYFFGTQLCTPDDPSFIEWIESVQDLRGTGLKCGQSVGAISGDVVDQFGSPVVGAKIEIYQVWLYPSGSVDLESLFLLKSTQAADDGGYLVDGLGEGVQYLIKFSQKDLEHLSLYYPNQAMIENSQLVSTTLGSVTENINGVFTFHFSQRTYLPLLFDQ